jgi:hypothetical protein
VESAKRGRATASRRAAGEGGMKRKAESRKGNANERCTCTISAFQYFRCGYRRRGDGERERSINDVHVGWMEKIAGSYVLTVVDICI